MFVMFMTHFCLTYQSIFFGSHSLYNFSYTFLILILILILFLYFSMTSFLPSTVRSLDCLLPEPGLMPQSLSSEFISLVFPFTILFPL